MSNESKKTAERNPINRDRIEYYIVRQRYIFNRTKTEISDYFNISRSDVHNKIKKGIIKNYIKSTVERTSLRKALIINELFPPKKWEKLCALEEELIEKLGLGDCIVACSNSRKDIFFKTAVWYIQTLIKDEKIITFAGGRTIKKIVDLYNPRKLRSKKGKPQRWKINLCTLNTDTIREDTLIKSSILVPILCEKFKAKKYIVNPIVYHDPHWEEDKRKNHENCPECQNVLENIKNSNIVVLGIGSLEEESTFIKGLEACNVNIMELNEKLRNEGEEEIVGDIANFAITEKGEIIPIPKFDKCIISPHPSDIINIISDRQKFVIGIAKGNDKIKPIIGSARAKLIKTLITDKDTAKKLVEYL